MKIIYIVLLAIAGIMIISYAIVVIRKAIRKYREKKVVEYQGLVEYLEPDDFYRYIIHFRSFYNKENKKKITEYNKYKLIFTKSARKEAISNKIASRKPYEEQRLLEKRQFAYKYQDMVFSIFAPFYLYYNLKFNYSICSKEYSDSVNYGFNKSLRPYYAKEIEELSFLKMHYNIHDSVFDSRPIYFSYLPKNYIIKEIQKYYSIDINEAKKLFKELCANDILSNSTFSSLKSDSDYYKIGKTLNEYHNILSTSDLNLYDWIKTKLPPIKPMSLSYKDIEYNKYLF